MSQSERDSRLTQFFHEFNTDEGQVESGSQTANRQLDSDPRMQSLGPKEQAEIREFVEVRSPLIAILTERTSASPSLAQRLAAVDSQQQLLFAVHASGVLLEKIEAGECEGLNKVELIQTADEVLNQAASEFLGLEP